MRRWPRNGSPRASRRSSDLTRLPVVNLAAREQRTLAVGDVLQAPELTDTTLGHVRELADRGVRAVLAAPIVSFGRVIGVLALHRAEPTTWLLGEISLAEAIAHETAIAIDTSRLLRESTRQAQVERGFYRIAAVLSEPLSAEATHDAVAQAAAEALGGDSAAVLRAVRDELELAGSYELAAGLADYLQEDAAALTACARGGKLLASHRLVDDGRFGEGLARAAAAADRRSLLAVPLPESSGRGVGLVLVFYAGRRGVRRRAARAGRAGRRRGARRPGAKRALRARAPLPGAGATACTGRAGARRRARSRQRARPGRPPRRAARGRRGRLGAHARGRRGGRAGRDRGGRGRGDRHARSVDRLPRRRHRPDPLDPRGRGRPYRPPPRRGRPDARSRLRWPISACR